MNALKAQLLTSAVTEVLKVLPEDLALRKLDKLIDEAEDYIEDSKTKIDDIFVLPMVKKIRDMLGVPDYPDEN